MTQFFHVQVMKELNVFSSFENFEEPPSFIGNMILKDFWVASKY
jgi:hypothetical protein